MRAGVGAGTMRWSWKRKLLLAMIAAVLLLGVFHAPILTAAANFLKRGCEAPAQAEAIVVLGGETEGARTRKGAELFKQGLAPWLVLSDGTRLSWRTMAIEEMYALAVTLGVPEDRILREERSRSTYENALYSRELLEARGIRSALVVTSDWHGRRSEFVFEKVFKGSGIAVNVCGTPDLRSDFNGWWKDGEKQQVVLTEWAKTLMYWAKYVWR